MKGILIFNLPHEQSAWDEACKVRKYRRATNEALEYIRNKIKRCELTDNEESMLEELRRIILEEIKD